MTRNSLFFKKHRSVKSERSSVESKARFRQSKSNHEEFIERTYIQNQQIMFAETKYVSIFF